MKTLPVITVLLACSLTPSSAQDSPPREFAGEFVIQVGPRKVGTESVATKVIGEGRREVRSEIALGPRKLTAVTVIEGDREVEFAFGDGPAAKRWPIGEYEAFAANNVWHHYMLLVALFDAEKKRRAIKVQVPGFSLDKDVSLRRAPDRLVDHDGNVVRVQHLVIGLQAFPIDIYRDEQGTVFGMTIPLQNASAIRVGFEELFRRTLYAHTGAEREILRADRVTFENNGLALVGTLTLPRKGDAPYPCVVPISGSGVQDRDGNPGGASLFRHLAVALAERGIATLRVDDRAAGESAIPTAPTTYRDLIADASAAITLLRGRDDIDVKRIAVLGHSEGAQTAGILAAEDPKVAAVVLMAGTSHPLDKIVDEQGRYQLALTKPWTPKTRPMPMIRQLQRMFQTAKTGAKDEKISDLNGYLRDHLALDPRKTIGRVKCPILVLQGERDRKVLAYHAFGLVDAAIAGGNKRVSARVFSNLSHDFTPFPEASSTLDAETIGTVDREVIKTVQRWLVKALRKSDA